MLISRIEEYRKIDRALMVPLISSNAEKPSLLLIYLVIKTQLSSEDIHTVCEIAISTKRHHHADV
jgi:hypothetical protein